MTAALLIALPSLLAKATVVLAAAALLDATVLRRRSASARHAAWSVALLGLLALPLLSALLPRRDLAVLPAPSAERDAAAAHVAAEVVLQEASSRRADEELASEAVRFTAPGARAGLTSALSAAEWALLIWVMGAALGLARIAGGAVVATRLCRTARPAADPAWPELAAEVSHALGLRRRVPVLESADVALPIVWGYRHARVLLPQDAKDWPRARRRAFLLHELAHVQRHDCLVLTLAAIVQALYWPHPLVWWSMRRLRREAEHACDDRVLAAGTRGPEYAEHLLDVARTLQDARTPAVVMGIAERSNLEDRLLAVLDPHLRRGAVGRYAVMAAGAAGLAIVAAVAPFQPVARAAVAHVMAAVTAPLALPVPPAESPVETEDVAAATAAPTPRAKPTAAPRPPERISETAAASTHAEPQAEEPLALAADVQTADVPADTAPAPKTRPEPAPAVVVRLGVDLVQLDAVVTDGDGHPITDLAASDFEVRVDGRRQEVTHARYVVADAAGAASPEHAPADGEIRRTITIVVDEMGLSFPALAHVRDGLRRLVEQRLSPYDRVAIVTTSRPTRLREALTSDVSRLTAAVDALRYDAWNRTASMPALAGGLGARGRSPFLDAGLGFGGRSPGQHTLAAHLGRKTLDAVEDYLVEMRGLPGRKSMLLFSDQLSLRDSLAPADGRGGPWIDADMIDRLQRVTDAAGRSAVVVYGVGSGVVTHLDAAERPSDRGAAVSRDVTTARRNAFVRRHSDLDGVARLAGATGGFLFHGGQHVDSVLDVILEDLRGYYLVGCTPDPETFRDNKKGKRDYRELEVRVRRPGAKARSRSGFYGVTDDETMPARPR